MSAALPATTRTKLAKLLTLLASPHPSERDAAGLEAHQLVAKAGLTWSHVLKPPPVEKALPQLGIWRGTVARCLEKPESLRPWEVSFLRALPDFRRLSVRQRYVLTEIADRVLGVDR